jgi:hypothetical protein
MEKMGSIVAEAQQSGLVAQNVVHGLTKRHKKGTKAEQRSSHVRQRADRFN